MSILADVRVTFSVYFMFSLYLSDQYGGHSFIHENINYWSFLIPMHTQLFVLLEGAPPMKVVLKCTTGELGVQFVMTVGVGLMPV